MNPLKALRHWLWKRKLHRLLDEDDKLMTKHAQRTGQIPPGWTIHTHTSGITYKSNMHENHHPG